MNRNLNTLRRAAPYPTVLRPVELVWWLWQMAVGITLIVAVMVMIGLMLIGTVILIILVALWQVIRDKIRGVGSR